MNEGTERRKSAKTEMFNIVVRQRQAQLQKNGFMGSIGVSCKLPWKQKNGKVESQLVETVQQVHTETSLSASHLAA